MLRCKACVRYGRETRSNLICRAAVKCGLVLCNIFSRDAASYDVFAGLNEGCAPHVSTNLAKNIVELVEKSKRVHELTSGSEQFMRNGASVYLNLHVDLHIMSLFRRRSNLI